MNNGVRQMLAEKFIIYLEALIKDRDCAVPTYSDGAPRVTSSSPHVPVALAGGATFAGPSASR
jgi:hypothetical protein